jgi:hypothetical protein
MNQGAHRTGRRRGGPLHAFRAFESVAAIGAAIAAIAPAVMATADGDTLRRSVSAYWTVDPRYLFWGPFTLAAVLLVTDSVISYVSPRRRGDAGRWFNIVLGVALLALTWFNEDDHPAVHYPAATLFFALFILVIAYTAALGTIGIHVGSEPGHDEPAERAAASVSLVFLLLLTVSLGAWALGLITFFFFEVFALVNFALHYVQGSLHGFPYGHYEFPTKMKGFNTAFRKLGMMTSDSGRDA